MTSQTWTSLQSTLLANTVKAQPVGGSYDAAIVPPDFANIFPQAVSYAENRIYRDLVLLATRQQNTTLTTMAGSRTVSLAAMANPAGGPIIVPEGFALVTPAGDAPVAGTRVPFDAATLDLIDQFWPTESATVTPSVNSFLPRLWALRDASTIVFAPTADAAYVIEITGLFQPTPMSANNPTTYLSTVYPELLEAACMIWLTGALLHNFGSQADDPKSAVSWEAQYQTLMASARMEEERRRGLRPDIPGAGGGH